MATMANEILGKVNGAGSEFKNKIQSTEGSIEKFAHNAGKEIGRVTSNFTDSASEYLRSSREYVKENPAKSMAVAAASGIVLGGLITLAMRRWN